jgi:cytochrome c-type biogenesis protein CcmE
MNQKNTKFVAGSVIIIAVLVWLGVSGFEESKSYYVTIPELREQGEQAYQMRLRLAGNVVPDTIKRKGDEVHFSIYQHGGDDDTVSVRYVGRDPLPDTLVDEAQAVLTGHYTRDNEFVAEQVQAKCASKYEALPGGEEDEEAGTGDDAGY